MTEPNGSGVGLTLRELVLEIRSDVKSLDEKIGRIDRTGSIGTKEELLDHEMRIRGLEKWRWGLIGTVIVSFTGIMVSLFTNVPL